MSVRGGLPPGKPAPPPDTYVALGDSYTSGPIIPFPIPPYGCLKSDHNYPTFAAPSIALPKFVDISCGGATTDDMTNPQDVSPDGPNPPQFSALDFMTGVVTLTIGGNDIGFTSIAENCASPTPLGTPCQDKYVVNGHDELRQRIADTAPKVAATLQGIHQHARGRRSTSSPTRRSSPRVRSSPARPRVATRRCR